MTTKAKEQLRDKALQVLRNWHSDIGINDFPKRVGFTVNAKKFREFSFRSSDIADESNIKAEDFIISHQPIKNSLGTSVAHLITYSVWYPGSDGRIPGNLTVRFSLRPSLVAMVKVGDYFIAVESDSLPMQRKLIHMSRMFGIKNTSNLNELGKSLIDKEFTFFNESLKSMSVTQLGLPMLSDPSTREEEVIGLLIELDLEETFETREQLENFLDKKNPEMLLYRIFSEVELEDTLKNSSKRHLGADVTNSSEMFFRDNFSLWILSSYFNSK